MEKKASLKERIKWTNFLFLLAAGIINAVGVNLFLAPVHLYDSGLSGTAMLLWQITPDWGSLALFLVILNLPFFLFGMKKQGLPFTFYSLFAVAVYAGASWLINDVLPIDVSVGSPFGGQDLVLCAIFGGIVSGIGSGLTLRMGGAIDGVEVMASIFAKRLGITVGTFVMIYNVILYLVVGFIRQSWILPLYSVLTYMAGIRTVDFIVEGLDKAKSAMIVTSAPNEVSRALSETFGRGVTLIRASGYYSGADKTMIYFVVNRFQIARMKRIVSETDPLAFVTITDVSDVMRSSLK